MGVGGEGAARGGGGELRDPNYYIIIIYVALEANYTSQQQISLKSPIYGIDVSVCLAEAL